MWQLFHDKHTEGYYNYCNVYREIQFPSALVGQKDEASRFALEAGLSSS